jgi:hypothetical protein
VFLRLCRIFYRSETLWGFTKFPNWIHSTPVLAGPEPPNQTGKKVTFWSQIVLRMQQFWLWVPWVTEGYIHPFPTFAVHSVRLLFTYKNRARTAVIGGRWGVEPIAQNGMFY